MATQFCLLLGHKSFVYRLRDAIPFVCTSAHGQICFSLLGLKTSYMTVNDNQTTIADGIFRDSLTNCSGGADTAIMETVSSLLGTARTCSTSKTLSVLRYFAENSSILLIPSWRVLFHTIACTTVAGVLPGYFHPTF